MVKWWDLVAVMKLKYKEEREREEGSKNEWVCVSWIKQQLDCGVCLQERRRKQSGNENKCFAEANSATCF